MQKNVPIVWVSLDIFYKFNYFQITEHLLFTFRHSDFTFLFGDKLKPIQIAEILFGFVLKFAVIF